VGYLGELSDSGYRKLTVDEIIALKDHGVEPRYVKDLLAAGLGVPDVDQVINLRDHGVQPAFVAGMVTSGLVSDLDFANVIHLRENDARGDDMGRIRALGFGPFTPTRSSRFARTESTRRPSRPWGGRGGPRGGGRRRRVPAERRHHGTDPRHEASGFHDLSLRQILDLARAGSSERRVAMHKLIILVVVTGLLLSRGSAWRSTPPIPLLLPRPWAHGASATGLPVTRCSCPFPIARRLALELEQLAAHRRPSGSHHGAAPCLHRRRLLDPARRGNLRMRGDAHLGTGRGQFRFVPDPTCAAKLGALGYEPIGEDDSSLMMLAVRDVSVAYASDVKRAGLRITGSPTSFASWTTAWIWISSARWGTPAMPN
jgi:hypothetical protein